MFIRCDSCGKLFNYEKHDGICPNCSAFNSPPGTGSEPVQARTREPDLSEPVPSVFEETDEDELFEEEPSPTPSFSSAQPAPSRSRKGCSGCGCLLALVPVLLILTGVLAGFWRNFNQEKRWTEWIRQSEEISFVSCSAGETVQTAQYTAQVLGDATAALVDDSALPEGEMLIGVAMHFEVTDEYSDTDNWYGSPVSNPYVMLEDGSCRAATNVWTLSSLFPELFAQCVEPEGLFYGEQASGTVYFVVPVGATSLTLCLEQRDESGEQLQAVYELPLSVTEVSA